MCNKNIWFINRDLITSVFMWYTLNMNTPTVLGGEEVWIMVPIFDKLTLLQVYAQLLTESKMQIWNKIYRMHIGSNKKRSNNLGNGKSLWLYSSQFSWGWAKGTSLIMEILFRRAVRWPRHGDLMCGKCRCELTLRSRDRGWEA